MTGLRVQAISTELTRYKGRKDLHPGRGGGAAAKDGSDTVTALVVSVFGVTSC